MFKSIVPNLMVEDVQVSINFYQKILGFSIITSVLNEQNGLQFALLAKDGFNLMVQERTNFIKEYPILDTNKVQPSISLYIQMNNLESFYDELKAKYTILSEMHTTFYGSNEFAIVDNSGYVLTFAEHS